MASKFINCLKNKKNKDAAFYLQLEEIKIWIDDLIENILTNFALHIYDYFLICVREVYEILDYCESKHENIDFEITYL